MHTREAVEARKTTPRAFVCSARSTLRSRLPYRSSYLPHHLGLESVTSPQGEGACRENAVRSATPAAGSWIAVWSA
jgi:hypothetical protein